MTVAVTLADWDGGNRAPVDTIAPPASLAYTSAWPGGDTECTFTLDLPADANPTGLRLGRRVVIYDGPLPVWAGVLADPQRGNPWQCTGQGLSTLGDRFAPIAGSPLALTADPNTAVDAAISRGLPWTRPATLPTPNVTQDPSQPDQLTVGKLLDLVAAAAGQRWGVDPYGQVTMTADPTDPDYLLIASQTPGGRTLDGYATDLYAEYGSDDPPALTAATGNPAAAGPFGRWEQVIDARAVAGSNESLAADTADKQRTLDGQPSFSGALTVQPGDLCTLGGQAVRLSTVRAGQAVRCLGTQPDPTTGQLLFTTSVQIVIGQWDYDAVADTAQLTPLGATRTDLTSVLTSALAS